MARRKDRHLKHQGDLDLNQSLVPKVDINLSLKTPDEFSFQPSEWTKWKNRFQRFRSGSGLDYAPDKRQIDVLIFNMGERAEDIFSSFSPEPCTYEDALAKF